MRNASVIGRVAALAAVAIAIVAIAYIVLSSGGPNYKVYAIFRNASQPFPQAIARAWGAALTLIVIVFVFTLLARLVSRRFSTGPR